MSKVISFSPPDISELEISEVCAALRSGWITTGPRTKLLERRFAAYIETSNFCEITTSKNPFFERDIAKKGIIMDYGVDDIVTLMQYWN